MSNALSVEAPEGLPFIDYTREFDAPVEDLFRAHADPELFARWVGPSDLTTELPTYDFTSGGRWRMVQRRGEEEYAFRGTFHTVRENELAVQTFEFEGFPDAVSLEFFTFEQLPGNRSRLVGHAVYPTLEARDGMVSSGMESGLADGYDQLDALLAERAA
ncbi:SRPBCC family protein [Desertihabitans aurantiacus]|uniref:SRPBCC family protein n=1 Tax=Desertihabitans aurantiacus TaxID=2282477 RepID=UPI000DF726EF|nr:SRPBCC family protein [Desertihabitans aurantiacus]